MDEVTVKDVSKLFGKKVALNRVALKVNIHKIDEYIFELKEVVRHEINRTSLTMMTSHGQQILSKLLRYFIQNNVEIEFSEWKQATLNDVYLANFKEKGAKL